VIVRHQDFKVRIVLRKQVIQSACKKLLAVENRQTRHYLGMGFQAKVFFCIFGGIEILPPFWMCFFTPRAFRQFSSGNPPGRQR